jgi:MFS family permease
VRDLLRDGPFRAFWLVNLISGLGTGAFLVALNWMAVRLHGPAGIAALVIGYAVPQFSLELFGGAMTDRLDRRRLFLTTETGALLVAMALFVVSIHGVAPLWVLVLASVSFGAISAFDTPVRTSLVNHLVRPHEIAVAQQFFGLSVSLGNVLGPVVGGVLMSVGDTVRSHEEFAFLFNAASYVPLLLVVPFLRMSPTLAGAPASPRLVESVRDGVAYVRGHRGLRSLLVMLGLVMLLGMPFQSLLPIFVHQHLSLPMGHTFYAALLAATGLGAFFGAWAGIPLARSNSSPWLIVGGSVGLGASILFLAGSIGVRTASLAAFLAGACGALVVNLIGALMQDRAHPPMHGRVAAIANLTKGLQALGAAAASLAIHRLGYLSVQTTLAAALLLATLVVWLHLRRGITTER